LDGHRKKVDLNQQAESPKETKAEICFEHKVLAKPATVGFKRGGQRQLPLKLLVYLIHEAYSSESSQVEEVVVNTTRSRLRT